MMKNPEAPTRLLIVDDEVDICGFLSCFFTERGFEVSVAHNGREALRILDEKGHDVMLLDIRMPVMGGMEVLKDLKKSGTSCKVIMVTKVDDPEKINEAKSLGAAEYLIKPLSLDELEKCVSNYARGKQQLA